MPSNKIKEILSVSNPFFKNFRALTLKKVREREGLFLAEGLKLIIDALEIGWNIRTLIFSTSNIKSSALERAIAGTMSSGGFVVKTSDKVMASLTRRKNPQSAIGAFKQRWYQSQNIDLSKNAILLGLDRIRDPGNLGTIIRTADAVGASGILLIGNTTSPFSVEAVRASMGSIFAIPVSRMSEKDFISWQEQFPGFIVGTHLKSSLDYRKLTIRKPILLLMGNEQQGLPDSLTACCHQLACIPQIGHTDSLNIAVATGIMLYEIQRKTRFLI
ncbi:MAG: RNA methyltransferase [Candidatus Tokpelaia sp. JSC161]|jgi:TrmH family RNA methyltransferase|nr:MAG: RNA methyltransferase [Candidatus Tokpelaia sp. JSC161]